MSSEGVISRVLSGAVSIVLAIVVVGSVAFGCGVYAWDRRPAGVPALPQVNFLWIHWKPAFPPSLAAQRDALQAELNSAKAEAKAVEAFDAATGQQLAQRDAQAQVVIQTRTRTLIQEVPHYVTVQADRDCTVPVGFVSVWNEASSGAAPAGGQASAPAGGADAAAPSGVVLSDIARAHIEDAATYQSVAQRLRDLQAYVRATSAPAPSTTVPTSPSGGSGGPSPVG